MRERCANRRQYPLLYFSVKPHTMSLHRQMWEGAAGEG